MHYIFSGCRTMLRLGFVCSGEGTGDQTSTGPPVEKFVRMFYANMYVVALLLKVGCSPNAILYSFFHPVKRLSARSGAPSFSARCHGTGFQHKDFSSVRQVFVSYSTQVGLTLPIVLTVKACERDKLSAKVFGLV